MRQDDVGCRRSGGKADVLGTRAKYALVSRRCPISGRTAATTPPARGFRGRNRRAPVVSAGRSRRFQRDVALDQRKGAPATNLGITTSILWIHVAYLRAIEPAVSMRLVSLSIGRPRLQVANVCCSFERNKQSGRHTLCTLPEDGPLRPLGTREQALRGVHLRRNVWRNITMPKRALHARTKWDGEREASTIRHATVKVPSSACCSNADR